MRSGSSCGLMRISPSRAFFRGTKEVVARAPRLTASGGFSYHPSPAWSASLRLRHVGEHPIVEDASAFAEGYTVADLSFRYRLGRNWEALFSVENLFNREFKEAQTYFASRLRDEPEPVPGNHFNPGVPFLWKVGLQYDFDF